MVPFNNIPCNSHCYICGRPLLHKGTRDHFVPKHIGGHNDISNLRPACQVCNALKNSHKPSVLLFITVAFITYTKFANLESGGYRLKAKSYILNKNLTAAQINLAEQLSIIKIHLRLDSHLGNLKINYSLSEGSSNLPTYSVRAVINDIIAVLQDSVEYYMLITKGVWPLDYWDDLLTPKPKVQEDSNMLNDLDYNNVDPLLISEKKNNIVYHHLVCSLCGSISDITLPNAKADVEIICPECLKVLNEFEVIPPIVKHLLRSRRDRVDKIATTVSDISNQLRKCLE